MQMPVMDGFQACEQIRTLSNGQEVKIIGLTSHAFKDYEERVLNAGCDAVLHKPYREQQLFSIMNEYLGVKFYSEKEEAITNRHIISMETKSIHKLPNKLIGKMKNAVRNCHNKGMYELLEQLPEENAEITAVLQKYVDNCDWEQLEAILDIQTNKPPMQSSSTNDK